MKNILNNNNGYILVFALIISILFPVLFFSFLAISSNTTKQNDIVESTLQSQSIAEMGAEYFQHAMTNEIDTKKTQIIQKVINIRDQDINKKEDGEYKILAITEMQKSLQDILTPRDPNKIPLNTIVKIQQNNNNSFVINPTNGSSYFSVAGDKLSIAFTSTGHDELKQADIKGTMEIDFANIISPGTGGGGSGAGSVLQNNTIADPGIDIEICPDKKKADLSHESCQIQGDVAYNQNDNLTFNNSIYRVSGAFFARNLNNKIDNSTLFILGSMTAENLNSMNNLKLHVGGALNVGHFNGSGLVDSTIEVGGAAAMQIIKLTRSTMYIDGNPKTTIEMVNGIEDSIIYINSKAEITKGADLYNNAKICVNGHLTIGNINNNFGDKSGIYAKSSNNSKVITDPVVFEAACTNGGSTATPGKIDYKTNYEYSY